MASLEELRAERLKKLDGLRSAGLEPYPASTAPDVTLAAARQDFAKLSEQTKPLVLAGRVRAIRNQGAIIFADLDDGTGHLQALLKKDEVGETAFNQFLDFIDVGDFIEVSGKPFLTKRREETILVNRWRPLVKSLRPLPDKWHGLQDIEERFRRRYLDLLMSPEVRERFLLRSRLIIELRRQLAGEGFLEVETPVLQPIAGGTNAEPFQTHHRALDTDLYLRVAPELYLKRLLVGGFPKVYEIGRNFRNEGLDPTHNPEFTMLEFYEAWSDGVRLQTFVEKLLRSLAAKVLGKKTLNYNGEQINLGKPFRRLSFFDLLQRHALITAPEKATREELSLKASQLGLKIAPSDSREKILDAIYKKACRPKIIQPTFIVNYPASYLPLAKRLASEPELADAFQLIIGGLELVKGFSELNDPLDQQARFDEQEKNRQAGDAEAQANDPDFLEALEYGMPPAAGCGIGLDRLTMLFANTANIKEVILFLTLKPKE